MVTKKAVLVVDDAPLVRSSVRTYLKIVGFDVDEAVDGLDGLEKAKAKHYDLVFSDYEMPNVNGLQFLERLKRVTGYEKTPVVMLTTVTETAVVDKAKSLGANHYMVKPFNNEKMQKVLHDLQML